MEEMEKGKIGALGLDVYEEEEEYFLNIYKISKRYLL